MESTAINIAPLTDMIVTLLVTLLSVVATFAINWVRQKAGLEKLQSDQVVRDYLEKVLVNALHMAAAKAGLKSLNSIELETTPRNLIIAEAAEYVIRSVPDALKRFGVTPEKVSAMLEARLLALSGGTNVLAISTIESSTGGPSGG